MERFNSWQEAVTFGEMPGEAARANGVRGKRWYSKAGAIPSPKSTGRLTARHVL